MRIGIVAAMTAVLFATNALATDVNAPLAPGKPAGVKQAQEANADNTILYIVGGAAVIAGIAILASSGNGGNTPNNSSTPTSSGSP
jgi:hypothetical protein